MHSPMAQLLLLQISAQQQQQRFYMLRFMWVVIEGLEKLGIPTRETEELRGLYNAFAEGIGFPEFLNSQQKGDDPDGHPLSS